MFHPNIFRLWLNGAFFVAWFTQNKLLTELIATISAVHFSFATVFHYLHFVQFWSYSKLNLSHRCNLKGWKLFVAIFLLLWEMGEQTLGTLWKKAFMLGSESVNLLIQGVMAAVLVVKDHSSITSIVFCFVFITISFHFAFTLMRFQSCNWTENSQLYCFPDRNNFRHNVSTPSCFQNAMKIIQLVFLD